jgi:SNF2 family DNA or RNA helicase
LRLAAKLKLKWTERWIAEFLELHEDKKLVCLTMHTFVIDHLKKRFPDCVVIDGGVTGRKRTDSVRLFQTNRRTRLLLGNWIAAGIGITLTAAHNAASLDFPWTPGHLEQGEDRIYRIGQTKDVTIHYLVALGTIEEKLMRILQKKSKVLSAVLDGSETEADLNVLEDLLQEMKRNAKNK